MSIRRIVTVDQAEWSMAPAPSWRLPRDIDWRYRAPEGEAVVWLLQDEQHHVASQARSSRWVRQLQSIAAVQALSQVELEFEPDAERLLVHEVVVWRQDADGAWRRRAPVPAEGFLLRQREQQLQQQVLHGRVTLVALLEDVRVGDALDVAWTVAPRERLPGLAFATCFAFAWRAPVAQVSVALHLADEVPLRWHLHPGGDGALPDERRAPGLVEWSQHDVPRLDAEPNVPGSHWHWPLLEVSAWSSWAEVATFLAALWQDALTGEADDIAAEAALLRGDLAPAQAITRAIRFVQEDVRYLAVDFGHGAGMLPNSAGTVLRRRFGDCKDKAVLLTALLRALGVAARPLLVAAQWREAVQRLMPSAQAFDHAIVAFEFEGRRHVVDPTVIGQRGDLLHLAPPPFGVGLAIAEDTTDLVEIPAASSASLLLREVFTLDRRGKGQVEQQLDVVGTMADDLRALLLRDGRQAFARSRAEALMERFPALQADIEGTRFDDDEDGNALVMHAIHALPTWGRVGEQAPPVFVYGAYGLLLGLDTVDERDTRHQPWAMRYPLSLQHQVVVRGRHVQRAKPSTFEHAGPGFRYRCEVRAKRREVSFDYLWETTADTVAATAWPDYVRERKVALDQTGALVNTRGPTVLQMLRGALLVLAVLGGFANVALRERSEQPPRLDTAARVAVERDAGRAVDALRRADFVGAYATLEPIMVYYHGQFDMQTVWAEAALRTGHLDVAAAAIAEARQLKPDHYLPVLLDANLLEARGDFAGARALFEPLVGQDGIDVRVLIDRARIIERSGAGPDARTAWEQVLARQPAQPDALYSLAHLMWLGGEQARADALIENAVRAQPTPSPVLEAVLQRYYAATGQHAAALAAARRAAALAPQDVLLARSLVMALLNNGQHEEALLTARDATARFADSAHAWSALATAAGVAKDFATAGPAFERWVALAPGDPEAHSGHGYLLHIAGDDARAREVLTAAVARFPAFGTLWLNYAVVLEALGDPAAADARRQAMQLMTPEQRVNLVR